MYSSERPPLPIATTTVDGKVLLGAVGAQVGAVFVTENSLPVGQFHTLNLTAVAASLSETAAGKLDIAVIGNAGPQGPAGVAGPMGDPGVTGPGYTQIATFKPGPLFYTGAGYVPTAFSLVVPMGHTIHYLHGGVLTFQDDGFLDGGEGFQITDISGIGTTTATLSGTITTFGDSRFKFFLSSAGAL
jgi:hypothetical protein